MTPPDALTAARACLAAAIDVPHDVAVLYVATARAKLATLRADLASLEFALVAREQELARSGEPAQVTLPGSST